MSRGQELFQYWILSPNIPEGTGVCQELLLPPLTHLSGWAKMSLLGGLSQAG